MEFLIRDLIQRLSVSEHTVHCMNCEGEKIIAFYRNDECTKVIYVLTIANDMVEIGYLLDFKGDFLTVPLEGIAKHHMNVETFGAAITDAEQAMLTKRIELRYGIILENKSHFEFENADAAISVFFSKHTYCRD